MTDDRLVGLAGAAEMLGMSKPNVRAFLARRGVVPVREEPTGPLFDRAIVAAAGAAFRAGEAQRARAGLQPRRGARRVSSPDPIGGGSDAGR